jgi:hypothetical protein
MGIRNVDKNPRTGLVEPKTFGMAVLMHFLAQPLRFFRLHLLTPALATQAVGPFATRCASNRGRISREIGNEQAGFGMILEN